MFCGIKNIRHSMNLIQKQKKKKKSKQTRKDQRVGTYEISKISFSCFCDKTHILNNGCGGLAPGC